MTFIKYQTLFILKLFSRSLFLEKMGGELWERCSYFGTMLSVGLDPLLYVIFSLFFNFFFFFFEECVFVLLGMEEIIKELG